MSFSKESALEIASEPHTADWPAPSRDVREGPKSQPCPVPILSQLLSLSLRERAQARHETEPPGIPRDQNSSFSANWICRAASAEFNWPADGESYVRVKPRKFGWFGKLKNSVRHCRRVCSLN